MKMNRINSIAALVGIACGFISTHTRFAGSWWNLMLWGLIGFGIGFTCRNTRQAKWAGGFYGFFLTISFLMLGFQGTSDKIPGFILFSLLLGVVGIICGVITSVAGNWLAKLRAR